MYFYNHVIQHVIPLLYLSIKPKNTHVEGINRNDKVVHQPIERLLIKGYE